MILSLTHIERPSRCGGSAALTHVEKLREHNRLFCEHQGEFKWENILNV